MTVIVFGSKALADELLCEVAATPAIEGGIGPVWVWYGPDDAENRVQYAQSRDGRCAVSHSWTAVDRAWLEAYLEQFIADGRVQLLDALPADWQYPLE